MKMELIDGSETSDIRTQAPGNNTKENILKYFDKLLNTEELSQRGNRDINEVEVEELTIEDVKKKGNGNLKNNKSVGSD